MAAISLITCTGDRPEAFTLLERWIARQTFQHFEWVVIDDGHEHIKPSMGQVYIPLNPVDSPRESFRRNMLVALEIVKCENVAFIEDDEYYMPWHVEFIRDLTNHRPLAGEAHAKYYHVRHRVWKIHPNGSHASLCQTGFKGSEVKNKIASFLRTDKYPERLDGAIWTRLGLSDQKKWLSPTTSHSIAIKGMPGRQGLGIHHTYKELEGYTPDPRLERLRQWIGADADAYEKFYETTQPESVVSEQCVGAGI